MPTVRMRVLADLPKGAVVKNMEPTAELEGNGQFNYACGGCKRILLRHMNNGTIYAFFGPSDVPAVLRCPTCQAQNLVPKSSAPHTLKGSR